jgi:hypothetical protein
MVNTIFENNDSQEGIYFENVNNSTINYSDLFNNQNSNFNIIPQNVGQITTTNANGDSCDTYHNIFLNPQFVNAGAGNFYLESTSPCIDAGDPASPLDPDSTITDIGAYYFHQTEQCLNSVIISADIVTAGGMHYNDYFNIAGLDSEATDGYDVLFDNPEPQAPPNNYLSLYFPHNSWNLPYTSNFMSDIRNGNDDLTDEVKTYQFRIVSDLVNEIVDLDFTIESEFSQDLGVVFKDLLTGDYQNIRNTSTYSFTMDTSIRSFELRLGDATPPMVEFIFPEPNISLYPGSTCEIIWETIDISPIDATNIFYSLDDGANWDTIGTVFGDIESIDWITPDTSAEARLKVEACDYAGNIAEVISELFYLSVIAQNYPPDVPLLFALKEIYPNPFNQTLTISFSIDRTREVSLQIYDCLGRQKVVLYSGEIERGYYQAEWNAGNASSGIYFVVLKSSGDDAILEKALLLK